MTNAERLQRRADMMQRRIDRFTERRDTILEQVVSAGGTPQVNSEYASIFTVNTETKVASKVSA
jgi:hypothetical protein